MGDHTRRGILARLCRQPSSVTVLADDLPVSRPAVSQHLQVLLEAGLVSVQAHGRQRIYTADPTGLEKLRTELDTFWSSALINFKSIAEENYNAKHNTKEQP